MTSKYYQACAETTADELSLDLFDDQIAELASACAQWRRGANAFMPTPGQLLALADPILRYRRALAQRAASLIDDAEKSPAR